MSEKKPTVSNATNRLLQSTWTNVIMRSKLFHWLKAQHFCFVHMHTCMFVYLCVFVCAKEYLLCPDVCYSTQFFFYCICGFMQKHIGADGLSSDCICCCVENEKYFTFCRRLCALYRFGLVSNKHHRQHTQISFLTKYNNTKIFMHIHNDVFVLIFKTINVTFFSFVLFYSFYFIHFHLLASVVEIIWRSHFC